MIDREQLKCIPELMELIEQEHTLEQVASVSFFRDVGSYLDEYSKPCYYPLATHVKVVFTDDTVLFTDKPLTYVPKSEEPEEEEQADGSVENSGNKPIIVNAL